MPPVDIRGYISFFFVERGCNINTLEYLSHNHGMRFRHEKLEL